MKLSDISNKLGRLQVKYPWHFLVAAFLVTAASGFVASGLKFDSSYEALLPEGAPEVKNVAAIRERTGGTRQIVIAIGGKDKEARIRFGRELATRLKKVDRVRATDIEFPVDFFRDRGLWLMDTATLDELVPAVEKAVNIAKWQANPMHLHLDEEEEKKELEDAWKRVDEIADKQRANLPFENVLTSKDGKYTFMLVVPFVSFTDMEAIRTLLASIQDEIAALDPESRGLEVRSAGNLDMMREQHKTIRTDLRNASILALLIGTLIVAVFTRKVSAPFLIGIPLAAGVLWTFALTRVFIGHVNIITGFFAAILIGLGIDFGVHIFVRFQQERQTGESSAQNAIVRAVNGTFSPALTSALTTAGTFLSFVIADFRGFSEFGLIAGMGVLLTLTASFAILPPLLVVAGRYAGATSTKAIVQDTRSSSIPRRVAAAVIVAILALAVFGLWHVADIPFRNNFTLLRGKSPATEFLDYVDENLGFGFSPAVIIGESIDDISRVADLAQKQKISGLQNKPSRIGKVFSIADLLPRNPEEARSRIDKLRGILDDPKLDRAAKKESEEAKKLVQARKMIRTEPWGAEDLPDTFKNRMITLDGKGYLCFIWPVERNESDYQAAAWDDELSALSKKIDKTGIEHSMADETLMLAWNYRMILADGPPLLVVASIVVLIFLLIDFRNFKHTALVAFPLSIGMLTFVCLMYLFDMEINMFNLIAVPSVIGIGIDNAVHIFHRYRNNGPGSIVFVIRTTGMAALVASLTTAAGFGSSLVSHHLGLKSLGVLAMLGIGSTFIAATIFFPCVLTLLEEKKKKHRAR